MPYFSRIFARAKPMLSKNSILGTKIKIFKGQKISLITIASFPKMQDRKKFYVEPSLKRFCSSKSTDDNSSSSNTLASSLKEISSSNQTLVPPVANNVTTCTEKAMFSSNEIISSSGNVSSALDASVTSITAQIDNQIPKKLSNDKTAEPLISSSEESISPVESIESKVDYNSLVAPTNQIPKNLSNDKTAEPLISSSEESISPTESKVEHNSLVAPTKPEAANSEYPKKEDIERAIFRVVAHFWDYGRNAFMWSREVVREHVIEDPSVKYYWKRFHDKMQESKKGF